MSHSILASKWRPSYSKNLVLPDKILLWKIVFNVFSNVYLTWRIQGTCRCTKSVQTLLTNIAQLIQYILEK